MRLLALGSTFRVDGFAEDTPPDPAILRPTTAQIIALGSVPSVVKDDVLRPGTAQATAIGSTPYVNAGAAPLPGVQFLMDTGLFTDVAATTEAMATDLVAAWRDGGAGAKLLVQNTSGARPTRTTDGVDFPGGAAFLGLTGDDALGDLAENFANRLEIEIEFNVDSLAPSSQTLIGWYNNANANPFVAIGVSSAGRVTIATRSDAAASATTATNIGSLVTVGTDHHLRIIIDGSVFSAWLDGGAIASARSLSASAATRTLNSFIVGNRGNGAAPALGNPFAGIIRGVKVGTDLDLV